MASLLGLTVLGALVVGGFWVVTDQPNAGDGHGYVEGEGSSTFQLLTFNETDGAVVMDSRFLWEFYPADPTTFEDVILCAYDRDGTVLASSNLGTFSTPWENRNVSLRTDRVPTYVFVDHPEFHDYPDLGLVVIRSPRPDRHHLEARSVSSLDSYLPFEYPRHRRAGECM